MWYSGKCHWKKDMVIRIQILHVAECISYGTKTLEKYMNLIILSPAMGKYPDKQGY